MRHPFVGVGLFKNQMSLRGCFRVFCGAVTCSDRVLPSSGRIAFAHHGVSLLREVQAGFHPEIGKGLGATPMEHGPDRSPRPPPGTHAPTEATRPAVPTLDDYRAVLAARAALHARFNPLREAAFRSAEAGLAVDGMAGVTFAFFSGNASWQGHPNRDRDRVWSSLFDDFRADDPACSEAAIWKDGVLCGPAVGAGAEGSPKTPGFVAIDYMERTPHAASPLRGRLLAVAVNALLTYAVALGRPGARLVRPNRYARASAARTNLPFVFVDNPGQRPYLSLHG